MIRAILCGACGKMGKAVAACAAEDEILRITAGVDRYSSGTDFPVFTKFEDITGEADVIIDFSNVSLIEDLLAYGVSKNLPLVIATTGHNDSQIEKIKEASKKIPIFFSFNMSLGINLLCSLVKHAAAVLGRDFDIEIVEKHHNQKLDAPSGTAIMLAGAINSELGDQMNYEYDRHSKRQKRSKNEIGIHSIRGGTIVGEHDVIFAGHDEVITISHSAASKEVFASGAIKAAKFIINKPAGLYDMNSLIKDGQG